MNNIESKIREKFNVQPEVLPPITGRNPSSRETLYELFAELGYTRGAEVGVFRGINALHMFQRIPNLKLLCVDPWKRNEQAMNRTIARTAGYDVTIIRNSSVSASWNVRNRSLDFVYIDGAHDFDNVMLDLIHWVPKVKIGGIVSGHDYFYSESCKVPRAVDAYIFAHGIRNLHLTKDNLDPKSADYPYSPSFFWAKTE